MKTDTRDPGLLWRLHTAQESMVARADTKAAILLAHQGGAYVLGVTVLQLGGDLRVLPAALILLTVAMLTAITVVVPILRPGGRRALTPAGDIVYFGHLRSFDALDLTSRCIELTPGDEAAMVARQVVTLSRLNWRKHRLLQISLALTMSAMLVGAAAVTLT